MKVHCILFFGFLMTLHFSINANETLQYSVSTDSLPKNILIINSFDAMSMNARKNKQGLFRELADSLKQVLYNGLSVQKEQKPIVVSELTADSGSTILLLMLENNASKAIVIKNLDVYFDQTGVEVTKEEGGKQRTASFDLCAVINYAFYYKEAKISDWGTIVCEFFTSRSVLSGLLAAGPDIVGKRKHAFKIVRKNAQAYLFRETHGNKIFD